MRIKKLLGVGLVSLAMAVGFLAPAQANASSVITTPFWRETVASGAQDKDAYHISHVYELQYRLSWAGYNPGGFDGVFGPGTKRALVAFQRANKLPQTGVANQATWAKLIPISIGRHGASRIPKSCKVTGWNICYDRTLHEVYLYRNGVMRNSWLVRGGRTELQTVVGNYSIYARNAKQVSSIYDSAPMPYSQFFYKGQAFHGSASMVNPFVGHSHGCINMYVEDSYQLWQSTAGLPLKTLKVHIYGDWN
jgi:hypothetical protein